MDDVNGEKEYIKSVKGYLDNKNKYNIPEDILFKMAVLMIRYENILYPIVYDKSGQYVDDFDYKINDGVDCLFYGMLKETLDQANVGYAFGSDEEEEAWSFLNQYKVSKD